MLPISGQISHNFISQFLGRAKAKTELLKLFGRQTIGAEIGVWQGEFSREILNVVKPKKLHLIDPWQFCPEYPQRWYGGRLARNQKEMDRIHHRVKIKFATRKEVIIHRQKSAPAAGKFPDRSLDWVFIDGNHSFEYVRRDLALYWRKVKVGGLIAGDDYWWGLTEGWPVKRAVDQFLKTRPVKRIYFKKGVFALKKTAG